MLSGVVRNWRENYTGHQSFEECSQHLDCLETSYRPANWLSIQDVFYTKVPGEHHEQLLFCLQKVKVSGNCQELLLQNDQIVLFPFIKIKLWLIKEKQTNKQTNKTKTFVLIPIVSYIWCQDTETKTALLTDMH